MAKRKFKPINPLTHTKARVPRKGKRKSLSQIRWSIREIAWGNTRSLLLEYVNARHGNAKYLATRLGVNPSQIHRYSCPDCEHEQEPPYSIGVAILIFLYEWKQKQLTIKPECIGAINLKRE